MYRGIIMYPFGVGARQQKEQQSWCLHFRLDSERGSYHLEVQYTANIYKMTYTVNVINIRVCTAYISLLSNVCHMTLPSNSWSWFCLVCISMLRLKKNLLLLLTMHIHKFKTLKISHLEKLNILNILILIRWKSNHFKKDIMSKIQRTQAGLAWWSIF